MKRPKEFAGIDDLVADIGDKYLGAEFGKSRASTDYRITCDSKYRVVSVGEGTLESLIERLKVRKETKLIFLIVEKTDGK